MRPALFETADTAGNFASYLVRFRTEKSVGFPQLTSKFVEGQRRESTSAA
jgi:hypothetical protein